MNIHSDQTGKILLVSDEKNYCRFLCTNYQYFGQKLFAEKHKISKKSSILIKYWEGNYFKKSYSKKKKKEFVIFGLISNFKKIYFSVNKKRNILRTLFINKIYSFCNFKNFIYILSNSKVFVFTVLGGEFLKILFYKEFLIGKFDPKIETSFNGKFLFILNESLFILESNSGITLKRVNKNQSIPYFFGLFNKNFIILGLERDKICFWNVRKNIFFCIKANFFLIKKKSIFKYVIQKKTHSEIILTHRNKTFFFYIFKIVEKNEANVYKKIIEINNSSENIDFLSNRSNLIFLTSYKKNYCPILIKNLTISQSQSKNLEKSNKTNKFPFFVSKRKKLIKKKKKSILCSILMEKKLILKKNVSGFRINYRIFKKKNAIYSLINQRIFKKFRFFLFFKNSKIFKKISPFFETCEFLYHGSMIEFISPENYLNLFLKELEIKKTNFSNFLIYFENLYISHYTWISKNFFLKEIMNKYKFFPNKTKLENIKTRFLTHFSIILKEIVNFDNHRKE